APRFEVDPWEVKGAVSVFVCGVVETRHGGPGQFMSGVVVPGNKLRPLLCNVLLPACLLLAGKPLLAANRHEP
ncbi:ion channel protein, partial [Salmonella enterica]|uniref:ion channel protein n=1 Tax=Salmonella enterica TaxID=28901 RepID=UPI00398C62FC